MKKIHDIIIIGGGIAGMTAGLYGHRSGRDILIIERAFFGGQIISTSEIENYPGFTSIAGHSFASELYSQIADTVSYTHLLLSKHMRPSRDRSCIDRIYVL